MTTKSAPAAIDAGDPAERAQVDVEVELEAEPEEQAPLEGARRHRRVADRGADGPEQDRVVTPELVEHRVAQHLAGADVARRAEVVVGGPERDAGRFDHLQRLGQHLRPDAVPADDRDVVGVPAHRRLGVEAGRWGPGLLVGWGVRSQDRLS